MEGEATARGEREEKWWVLSLIEEGSNLFLQWRRGGREREGLVGVGAEKEKERERGKREEEERAKNLNLLLQATQEPTLSILLPLLS